MPAKTAQTVPALAEELHLLVGQLVRRLRAAGATHELSWSELAVMARLEAGPAPIAALARLEGVKPQSMGVTIRGLEKTGLVSRRPHARDRRQVLFALTRAGRQLRLDAAAAKRAWLATELDQRLDAADRAQLGRTLALLLRLLEG